MRSRIEDAAALASVTPRALSAYLVAHGWRKERALGDTGDLYRLNGAPDIVAPASDHLADYAQDVGQILGILSKVEGRDELAIYRDLDTADVDLIRIRVPDAGADGSIPISRGVELVEQSKNLVLAAACAAHEPKRVFRAGSIREASDYLQDVRFGQTERGSYVITIVSPVPPSLVSNDQSALWSELDDEPFPRKVTRVLADALAAAREAVSLANRGGDISVFEQRVGHGVSANLCDSIAKLAEDGDGLDISLSWALTRPAPEKSWKIEFSRSDVIILAEAAKVLRDREPRPNERIQGFVVRLARDPEAREGQVSIRAPVDGKLSSIKVYFGPDQYQEVARAHADRREVIVEGDLKRDGQRWTLTSPRNLESAASEEEAES